MPTTLSGYQPGDEVNGLKELTDSLIAEFNRQRAGTGEVEYTLTVVGVLRLQSAKYDRDPQKEPTVELRFAQIEPAKAGSEEEEVLLETLRDLRNARRGELELELEKAAGVEDSGAAPGTSTASRGPAFSGKD